MFDLEKSIDDWRKQMLAAGIKTPVPLDELEIHLRDEIERQIKLGLNDQKAFEISIEQIGQPKSLKREFRKVERTLMKKIMIILLGIFGAFLGVGLIMPALAKYRDLGMWTGEQMTYCLLGVAIVIAGMSTAIYGFKKRKA
jgi:hypothetical protein